MSGIDDVPYGGGPGMVMKPEPIFKALDAISERRGAPATVLLMSPQGTRFTQRDAERIGSASHVVLLCGRYEGVDDRVRQHLATEEISIGDYVVSGGELPALVITGAEDEMIPVEESRKMASAIRGAQLVIVPGAGHLANLEQPEAFNAALNGFLAAL